MYKARFGEICVKDGEGMLDILKSGAFINFALVLLGSSIGMLLKRGIPEKIRTTLISAVALCVLYIGVTGLFESGIKPLVVIVSMALGAICGQAVDLDGLVNKLALKIENKVKKDGDNSGKIAEGFVSATLLFCVGAMTVVGSIDSGVSGDNTTLYSKSVIDCISSAVLASTLGFGVMLSSLGVLVIEGSLTLLAHVVGPILTATVVAHMSVIGSMLIIAIAFNLLNITKIKVMNIIPAVFFPMVLCLFT